MNRTTCLSTLALSSLVVARPAAQATAEPTTQATAIGLAQGPFIGHVEPNRALVWARASAPGELLIRLDETDHVARATASPDRALCVVWELDDLEPDRTYGYRIEAADGAQLAGGDGHAFRTAPAPTADGRTRILFGSCAREDLGTAQTWQQVAREDVDVVVLLGDTPYIDTTAIERQRIRYAEFASVAPMAALLRSTPWYGTWDDHDFGANDTDGRLPGRHDARRAFVEFHANPSYGEADQGIYTSFRRGPFEVFLLDTRYFAATEPSPFRKHHASLLGKRQWTWLRQRLAASTAPVKVLACGMIWNEATRPGKLDHWGSYAHEREALFDFIGKRKIDGVVLVGGDIHRSRVIRHASQRAAGYDIHELISSPMHAGVIPTANAPHPGLIKDMGEPQTFLLLEGEQRDCKLTVLRARFRNAKGREHFAIDLRTAR